jgi:hypothetical protein
MFFTHIGLNIKHSRKWFKVVQHYNISKQFLATFLYSSLTMDTDEVSRHSMDDYGDEPPHMWEDPISDIDSLSSTSAVKKNPFVDTKTTDKGYFCIKQRFHNRKFYIEGYSSSRLPGFPVRNAVTGCYETDYMGRPTACIGSPDEDRFFKVVLAIDGIGQDTRTLFYDSVGQYERHFKTSVSQSSLDKWNAKLAKSNAHITATEQECSA